MAPSSVSANQTKLARDGLIQCTSSGNFGLNPAGSDAVRADARQLRVPDLPVRG
ncbi:Mn-dependent DtxR family transcriptional regulator [Demequina lutea]|uniref:Mn-dependent DtxR family transcriptional regulator n=1 Tax=Demequina lutea TaxID=431489 RepID=A0A7Z0CHJ9_9MICO|nr:Mn-dependent DtxR family transcriptional regulator [Demequina lutea]